MYSALRLNQAIHVHSWTERESAGGTGQRIVDRFKLERRMANQGHGDIDINIDNWTTRLTLVVQYTDSRQLVYFI